MGEEFDTMRDFCHFLCDRCTNDWYCPTDCDLLEKVKRYPLERINKAFIDCEEDVVKLTRRIDQWK